MQPHESTPNQESSELSKIDTSVFVEKITKFNEDFAIKVLSGVWNKNYNPKKIEDFETTYFENLETEILPILKTIGLGLEYAKTGAIVMNSEGDHFIKEIKFSLIDGKLFIKYLQSLNLETVTENQKDGLYEIARNIMMELKSYDVNNMHSTSDRFIELFSNASSILEEYTKLGINGLTPLKNFLEYSKKGCLKEFMLAEKFRLDKDFVPLTGFILEWHRDATPQLLQKYWNGVIEALQTISQNERASDIYTKAVSVANTAIDSAIEDVKKWQSNDEDSFQKRYSQKFYPILTTIKNRLAEF